MARFRVGAGMLILKARAIHALSFPPFNDDEKRVRQNRQAAASTSGRRFQSFLQLYTASTSTAAAHTRTASADKGHRMKTGILRLAKNRPDEGNASEGRESRTQDDLRSEEQVSSSATYAQVGSNSDLDALFPHQQVLAGARKMIQEEQEKSRAVMQEQLRTMAEELRRQGTAGQERSPLGQAVANAKDERAGPKMQTLDIHDQASKGGGNAQDAASNFLEKVVEEEAHVHDHAQKKTKSKKGHWFSFSDLRTGVDLLQGDCAQCGEEIAEKMELKHILERAFAVILRDTQCKNCGEKMHKKYEQWVDNDHDMEKPVQFRFSFLQQGTGSAGSSAARTSAKPKVKETRSPLQKTRQTGGVGASRVEASMPTSSAYLQVSKSELSAMFREVVAESRAAMQEQLRAMIKEEVRQGGTDQKMQTLDTHPQARTEAGGNANAASSFFEKEASRLKPTDDLDFGFEDVIAAFKDAGKAVRDFNAFDPGTWGGAFKEGVSAVQHAASALMNPSNCGKCGRGVAEEVNLLKELKDLKDQFKPLFAKILLAIRSSQQCSDCERDLHKKLVEAEKEAAQ